MLAYTLPTMPASLTPEEIDSFDLYNYWDNKTDDDPNIPDAQTVREILQAQGFYN